MGIIFESSLLSIIFSLELKIFLICYSFNKKQLFSICLSTPTGNFFFFFFLVISQCYKALKIFLKEAFLGWVEIAAFDVYILCCVLCCA